MAGVVNSMSGWGRTSAAANGIRITCEIRTTNHRYLDSSVSLPPVLSGLEPVLRKMAGDAFRRGRVEISVNQAPQGQRLVSGLSFNEETALWYLRKLAGVASRMKLAPPRVDVVAGFPGVITREEPSEAGGKALAAVRKAVAGAIGRAARMRRREGRALAADILRRIGGLENGTAKLGPEWVRSRREQEERTRARVLEALERIDEKKVQAVKELIGTVEKGDVAEEITRLRSHFGQFRGSLASGGAVGRRLDFLIQEVNRELHTIGAKSSDAEISRIVVGMKEEAERIREQVQNLE